MTCTEPTEPAQGAALSVWAQYFKDYAEYTECLENKGSGICSEVTQLDSAAQTCLSKITISGPPPGPLGLTPSGTSSGLCDQMVSVGDDALAQDSGTEAGKKKMIQDYQWARDWLLPASKTGTLAQLEGC